ncbi:hypothetical protein CG402_00040 [Bifidobacteriaceae bacterium NR020]|nr:hypothetical protein CG402_00040 [Bifidobacteriaceae bacterium NR020]
MKAHCAFNSEQARRSELLSRAKSLRSSRSSRVESPVGFPHYASATALSLLEARNAASSKGNATR